MKTFSQRLLLAGLCLVLLPLFLGLFIGSSFYASPLKLLAAPTLQRELHKPLPDQKVLAPYIKRITQSHQAIRQGIIWASIAAAGLSLVLLLLAWSWLLRYLVQQLRPMREQLKEATPSDNSTPRPLYEDPITALHFDLQQHLAYWEEHQQNEVFAEQLERWQDIARRLAHEIKNPLTPILLAVQELHKQYRGDDQRYRRLLDSSQEIVREEIETLRRLVEEFSGFAKLPEAQLAPTEINQFLHRFLESYQWFEGQAEVHFRPHPGPCWGMLDTNLLKRVMHNLVKNAIEAGSPEVTLQLGALPGRQVAIQVEDKGPGIPEHLQSKIFTPYFTTKQFGSGLGLAITKKIVLDHGGSLKVNANPQGGATFSLIIPALQPPDSSKNPTSTKHNNAPSSPKTP